MWRPATVSTALCKRSCIIIWTQVKAEIEVLHSRKAEVMRAVTQAQCRELEDICAAARMAAPPLPACPPAPEAAAAPSGAALCAQACFFVSLMLLADRGIKSGSGGFACGPRACCMALCYHI